MSLPFGCKVLIPFVVLVSLAAAAGPAAADILFDSFETEADLTIPEAHHVQLVQAPLYATDGQWSAQTLFAGGKDSFLHFRNTASWWPASAICFDAYTDGAAPVHLVVNIESGDRMFPVNLVLQPGRTSNVCIPCEPLTRGHIDAMDLGAYAISGDAPPILTIAVTGFTIGLAAGEPARELFLDNVRLQQSADRVGPVLVDDFGQYMPIPWPGKLTQDDEFQVDAAREPQFLASWHTARDLDRYGGVKGGELGENPYFTVQKAGGRWRLVDPLGDAFFVLGCNSVSIDSGTAKDARSFLYSTPPNGHTLNNFYLLNLNRKYGLDYGNGWSKSTASRLRAWGFNTLGPDSAPDTFKNYPVIIDAGDSSQIKGIHHVGPFPDVFDAGFAAAARAALDPVSSYRDDSDVIGFTFDRGLPWDRLGDPAFILAAGGPAADRLREIARAAHAGAPEPTAADMAPFEAEFAARYFQGIADALRAADHGHHLYLGCRFTSIPAFAAQACAHSADVVTLDDFGAQPGANGLGEIIHSLDKPVLISAFTFTAEDRGLLAEGMAPVDSQADRAASYTRYVKACGAEPQIIGCLWDRYLDQAVLSGDKAGSNDGLVSVTDRPYTELVAAAARTNDDAAHFRYQTLGQEAYNPAKG